MASISASTSTGFCRNGQSVSGLSEAPERKITCSSGRALHTSPAVCFVRHLRKPQVRHQDVDRPCACARGVQRLRRRGGEQDAMALAMQQFPRASRDAASSSTMRIVLAPVRSTSGSVAGHTCPRQRKMAFAGNAFGGAGRSYGGAPPMAKRTVMRPPS